MSQGLTSKQQQAVGVKVTVLALLVFVAFLTPWLKLSPIQRRRAELASAS